VSVLDLLYAMSAGQDEQLASQARGCLNVVAPLSVPTGAAAESGSGLETIASAMDSGSVSLPLIASPVLTYYDEARHCALCSRDFVVNMSFSEGDGRLVSQPPCTCISIECQDGRRDVHYFCSECSERLGPHVGQQVLVSVLQRMTALLLGDARARAP
jgi:hypothetical protein